MTERQQPGEVRMIPIDRVDVLNPRERNGKVFDEIVENIKTIGLKKPITVTPRAASDGGERYKLVCGEGRLKAFQSLGETMIPALVVHVSDEDAFLMSLAENIARRQCRSLELLSGIRQLHEQGYTPKVIAEKTGLTQQYIQGILTLLQQGEEQLLVAVRKGEHPTECRTCDCRCRRRRQGDSGRTAGGVRVGQAKREAVDGCASGHRAAPDPR